MLIEQVLKRFEHLQIKVILHVSDFLQFVHQFGKYELIGLDAPFRDIHFIGPHGIEGVGELGNSGKDTVDLKSVTPSGRVLVVLVQKIVAGDMLPVLNRFGDGGNLVHGVHEGSEEGGLAASDVSFNRVDDFPHCRITR